MKIKKITNAKIRKIIDTKNRGKLSLQEAMLYLELVYDASNPTMLYVFDDGVFQAPDSNEYYTTQSLAFLQDKNTIVVASIVRQDYDWMDGYQYDATSQLFYNDAGCYSRYEIIKKDFYEIDALCERTADYQDLDD